MMLYFGISLWAVRIVLALTMKHPVLGNGTRHYSRIRYLWLYVFWRGQTGSAWVDTESGKAPCSTVSNFDPLFIRKLGEREKILTDNDRH